MVCYRKLLVENHHLPARQFEELQEQYEGRKCSQNH